MRPFGISLVAVSGLWLLATSAIGQDTKLKDEDISKLLVGKWLQEKQRGKDVPVLTKVVLVVKKDNTFVMDIKGKIGDTEKSSEAKFTGTWKVVDAKLEMTIKTVAASAPGVQPLKEGDVATQTIIEINDTTFKSKNDRDKGKGPESVWKRAKD
jgi:hypothetical protein